ncbi:protein C3orf33-like [Liolophura sinensis]|uniref:protein C3orf33-like n=1 Tax=Liolophura sinensis TaxID=3198878 RepID=UPI0031594B99
MSGDKILGESESERKAAITAADGVGTSLLTKKDRSLLDSVFILIDENIRTIRYSLYAVGAIGALILARSLHVHKKFTKLSDIPVEFITKNISFRGHVKAVDRGHLLHVDHLPIYTLRWLPSGEGLLPVRLAGVRISPVGSKWLADKVMGNVVKVTPLQLVNDAMDSVVFLEKGFLRRSTCVNKALIEQGLCKVDYPDTLPSSDAYRRLLDSLIACETRADRKGKGLWGNRTTDITSQQRRWSLKNSWNWLCGKFVKRKS